MDRDPYVSPEKFLGWKQSRGRLAGRVFLCSFCLWLVEQAVMLPTLLSCRELQFSGWQMLSLKLFVEETRLKVQSSLSAKATGEKPQLVWPLPVLSFLVLFSIVRRVLRRGGNVKTWKAPLSMGGAAEPVRCYISEGSKASSLCGGEHCPQCTWTDLEVSVSLLVTPPTVLWWKAIWTSCWYLVFRTSSVLSSEFPVKTSSCGDGGRWLLSALGSDVE